MDDGSTDHSVATAREYAARDSRFKVFQRHREPKGAPTCRNIGLERAEGELIIFFDSDDIMLEYCLENRVKYFEKDENLDLLISYQMRMENGEVIGYVNVPSDISPIVRFFTMAPDWDIPWVNNTLIRKKFLEENRISWNESIKLYQDIQFNVELLSKAPTFKWSKDEYDSLWVYSDNVNNIGKRFNRDSRDIINVFEFYKRSIDENKLSTTVVRQMNSQFHFLLLSRLNDLFLNERSVIFDEFMRFLQRSSKFNSLDILLFKTLYKIKRMVKRNYIHRLIRRKIEERIAFLRKKNRPVIENGQFLKIKELKN